MWSLLLTLAVAGAMGEVVNVHVNDNAPKNFSFEVDYDNNQFLLDGEPFRYVSGSFHYFRAPSRYWRDRLRKMRAAGLNAVSTYVEWSLHEPKPDVWHWSGDADLVNFLSIAQEEGLMVLLRPGPYICAERDFGGLPYWLLTSVPDIRLRTNDPRYMSYVERYLTKLFEKVDPYLRGNGGPIIMVQVENEYGSYACDSAYMNRLRDFMEEKIGTKALLYTTDGNNPSMLRCGAVTGAYATVDFGAGSNVTKSFETMRLYQPKGPFVNSEFYPGWLSSWQQPFQRVQAGAVTKTLDEMLSLGASVNMYMFFGGTNFGYTSGANTVADGYQPQLTSYDYDAPLTEAGDPTPKYFQIRDVIAKYLPMPNMSLPTVSPKGSYGSVYLSPVFNLFDTRGREKFATIVTHGSDPLTFEALNLPHWLALYETNLAVSSSDPAILRATPRDRTLVYVGDHLVGAFSRTNNINDINIEEPYQKDLKLLVENQGRVNFGSGLRDFKGIWNVTLNNTPLRGWTMTGFSLDSITLNDNYPTITVENGTLRRGPVVLRGKFAVPGEPMDTYLNTIGWGKGVAFVNGWNLGRYWPVVGPQITLYVPASYLRSGENELVLVELEYAPSSRKMKFQDTPILDQMPRSFI